MLSFLRGLRLRSEHQITHPSFGSPVPAGAAMARRLSDRTPELVILALIAALAGGALLLSAGGSSSGAAEPGARVSVTPARIVRIERRVEALRGLRFRHPVPVSVVSPGQARREGLAQQERAQPPAEQQANEELLKLLALLPPDADTKDITAAIFGEQVAGFYDPRRKRLALVRGVGADDVTLAHELTHALEDQHFDLRRLGSGAGDDRTTAEQALVEGTATLVMERYAARWPSSTPLGDALSGFTQVTSGTPLPPYVLRSLVFPYFAGERFVQALRDANGGGWALVDVALRDRPPGTTAEILQPERWLRAQQPLPASLAGARPPHSGGWRRLAGSTLGEEDVAALLAPTSGPVAARRLTAGWRGGRYALWRRGPLAARACAAPCRERDALSLAVRVATPPQARALAAAFARWLDGTLHARIDGSIPWPLPSRSFAAAKVERRGRGRTVRVALAPSAGLARRLVG
jgi:hypothetical protein